jgi:hypothetical protein
MHDMIDPLADNMFDGVSTVSTPDGTIEHAETTSPDTTRRSPCRQGDFIV